MEEGYLYDDEIDRKIMIERRDSALEINRELSLVYETFTTLAEIVNDQRERLDEIETSVDETLVNVEAGTDSLLQAEEYRWGPSITRNIALVVSGGAVGSIGFVLGPLVGIVTTVVGAAGGGAAAVTIQKIL